jgi:hypothetical protein
MPVLFATVFSPLAFTLSVGRRCSRTTLSSSATIRCVLRSACRAAESALVLNGWRSACLIHDALLECSSQNSVFELSLPAPCQLVLNSFAVARARTHFAQLCIFLFATLSARRWRLSSFSRRCPSLRDGKKCSRLMLLALVDRSSLDRVFMVFCPPRRDFNRLRGLHNVLISRTFSQGETIWRFDSAAISCST